MKDIRSLLLILLSTGLVATWIYHIYDKTRYTRVSPIMAPETDTLAGHIRDSLQSAYTAHASYMDVKLDSTRLTADSLKLQLNARISEINALKGEISAIIGNPKSTALQLKSARQKMTELEEKVEELRLQNSSMETEKQELSARLAQATGEVSTMEKNIRRLDDENRELKERISAASAFMVSALHFAAIDLRNDKEQETVQSKKADKFVASFLLQNNLNQYLNAEVFVVITQPDGTVLQNSTWDSGTFDMKSGGKKSFTRRIRFDYEKGEQKRLIFSLDNDHFEKGKYTLQVWHQGVLVGEIERTLH